MNIFFVIFYYNFLLTFSENLIKPKICVNCKFFKKRFIIDNKYGRCSLFPIEEKIDFLVDGVKNKDYEFCSIVRQYGKCGEEGKLYVEK